MTTTTTERDARFQGLIAGAAALCVARGLTDAEALDLFGAALRTERES